MISRRTCDRRRRRRDTRELGSSWSNNPAARALNPMLDNPSLLADPAIRSVSLPYHKYYACGVLINGAPRASGGYSDRPRRPRHPAGPVGRGTADQGGGDLLGGQVIGGPDRARKGARTALGGPGHS